MHNYFNNPKTPTNTKLYKDTHSFRDELYDKLAEVVKKIEESDIAFHKLVAQAEELVEHIQVIEDELQNIEKQELKDIFNLKKK